MLGFYIVLDSEIVMGDFSCVMTGVSYCSHYYHGKSVNDMICKYVIPNSTKTMWYYCDFCNICDSSWVLCCAWLHQLCCVSVFPVLPLAEEMPCGWSGAGGK